jgi:hypothetical protein
VGPSPALEEVLECALVEFGSVELVGSAGPVGFAGLVGFAGPVGLMGSAEPLS